MRLLAHAELLTWPHLGVSQVGVMTVDQLGRNVWIPLDDDPRPGYPMVIDEQYIHVDPTRPMSHAYWIFDAATVDPTTPRPLPGTNGKGWFHRRLN